MDKRKSGLKCALAHCGKTKRNTSGIKMFKFPAAGSVLGNIWRQVCGLPMDKDKIQLCETHFSKDLIGMKQRKRDAIPSLFLTSNNNEAQQQLEPGPSIIIKLETPDKRELNCLTKNVDESFCSNCVQNLKDMHYFMGKCSLLQKETTILQARIKSLCKFQKRTQIKMMKLKNLYYTIIAEKSLKSRRYAIGAGNLDNKSKCTKVKPKQKGMQLIQSQKEMKWTFLTDITEDIPNQEIINTDEKKDEERFVCQALPIQNTEGTETERQYNNEMLSSRTSYELEALRVKRNEIISRYRQSRDHFLIPNKIKQTRINDKTRLWRKRSAPKYSELDEIETRVSGLAFETKNAANRKNETSLNYTLAIDEIKIEKEVLQDATTTNTIPAKQNVNLFFNMQNKRLHELSSPSNSNFMEKKSSIVGSLPKSSIQHIKIDQRKVEESLNNMRLLIKAPITSDRFAVFGQHISQKLNKCEKDIAEVKIAKSLIDSVLENLASGVSLNQNW